MADEWQCQASRNTCAHTILLYVHQSKGSFTTYFLIVANFLSWSQNISTFILYAVGWMSSPCLQLFVILKNQFTAARIESRTFAKVKGELKTFQSASTQQLRWATTLQWISVEEKLIIQLYWYSTADLDSLIDRWRITQFSSDRKLPACVKHPVIQRCTGSHWPQGCLFFIPHLAPHTSD